jgi:hypothetical protein
MRSLDYHAHSMWLQDAVQTVRYFRSHFFLNLKTFRVDIDEACKLRNSNDSIPGQIANVNASDDRRHVVLAVGFKSDISQQHDFVVPTHLFEGSVQVLSWVLKISGKPLLIGAHNAGGSAHQSFAIRVIA